MIRKSDSVKARQQIGRLLVRHETISMSQLPLSLVGLKILHISDLHANGSNKYLKEWQEVWKLDYGLVVITGDIILNKYRQIEPYLPVIMKMLKKAPVFFVDGNHEIYEYCEMKKILEDIGVIVLENQETDCILKSYGHIKVVGVRDYYYLQEKDFNGIDRLFNRSKGEFKLILSHQPQLYDRIKEKGPFLLFAGHTHGGQVRLPFAPTLYAPGQGVLPKYGDGLYKYRNAYMYISRGIGTTLFPIRTFNPPELTVMTLLRK